VVTGSNTREPVVLGNVWPQPTKGEILLFVPTTLNAVTAVAGVLGALGGVIIGSLLSNRAQQNLLHAAHRREDRQVHENAYVAFLASYRKFRIYVLTEAQDVRLVVGSVADGVPLIKNAMGYSDAVSEATARLHLLEDEGSPVITAALAVQDAFKELARTRATHPPGALPEPVVEAARQAEQQFTRAAQQALRKI